MSSFVQTPYACLQIDVSARDLLATTGNVIRSVDRAPLEKSIARLWGGNNVLVCLSARSALDLYLQARSFPPGSRVLISAVNIPDISVVLRYHNLVPVPFDIDLDTMAPKLSEVEAALSAAAAAGLKQRYVAVLVAHLYGRRFDLAPFVEVCRRFGVDLIEDAAEAFSGLIYTGHPDADLSFFSFGTIKHSTAFGGGICRVRDPAVFERMRMIQRYYPVQSRKEYLKKCAKGTAAAALLNLPPVSGTVMRTARALDFDHKALVVSMVRGFPDKLMERLRQQPSLPLLATLYRRLVEFDAAAFQEGTAKGDFVLAKLRACVFIPGHRAPVRNYWLYPIVIEGDRPMDQLLKEINDRGVDAYRGATQLSLVQSLPEQLEPDKARAACLPPFPREAARLMERVIYLPVHRRVPHAHLERICQVVTEVVTGAGGPAKRPVRSKL